MILASTNEDSIILDPFIGSGTTLLAAKMLNRKSIGIDVEKEYINLANKRIKGLKTSEE